MGKTYALAVAALWWLARYPDGIVLTTSSTFRQVKTQLWSEIHRLIAQAKVDYPELKNTELRLRDDSNFALGFSTDRVGTSGLSWQARLDPCGRSTGHQSAIWDAIAGIMAGGKVHIVMAGNPTLPSGAFYDPFTRARGLWNCIRIDAFDSPNLRGSGSTNFCRWIRPRADRSIRIRCRYLVTRRLDL